ncbi:nuclear transport factor 2 family protein [Chitinibacter fontanus]|uniref:Nuclear transport factor 2 family protein n=1 Tax=Chitinibacter fontanus TaxID=1737446 RepID=A0A7D5VBA8_9NEIS|nr:nuclear transport factor 2 family protein [Chitinibacter fontanus]QLI82859.1 nuclear transport factor 2 family protein [Chitinibacter fontanus]
MTPIKIDELLAWYAGICPETLDQVAYFYQPQARFKDPFNDVHGPEAIRAIFAHMFATTDNPRFVIGERLVQGQQAFVSWRFEFGLKGKNYQIEGGSHLTFGDDGRVVLHRDYWDAAEELLQKLPVIGGPIRWLRRQFVVKL